MQRHQEPLNSTKVIRKRTWAIHAIVVKCFQYERTMYFEIAKMVVALLQTADCGQYVSQYQITYFFNQAPCITQEFDYCETRALLFPFLCQREKEFHAYTHMFTPLISGCGVGKLK